MCKYYMLTFFQWLEYNDLGGEVAAAQMNNVAADDAFKRIRSKWMAGNIPQRGHDFDPETAFGKKRSYMKSGDKKRKMQAK